MILSYVESITNDVICQEDFFNVGITWQRGGNTLDVCARHGCEPFGPQLKAEGLMECPFEPAQGKGSPLYVNPVNMLNILTKVLAEEQVLRSLLVAGSGTARLRRELSRM